MRKEKWMTRIVLALALFSFGLLGCSKKAEQTVEQKVQPSAEAVSASSEAPVLAEGAVLAVPPDAAVAQPETGDDRKEHALPEELQSFASRSASGKAGKSEIPIRLSALMDMGQVVMAGLVDTAGGGEAMVQEGNVFRGYTVKAIDLSGKTVTLERKGQLYTLAQIADPNAPPPARQPVSPLAGNTNIPSVFMNPDLRNIPTEQFEPTQDEIARGINPNDSSTWPKGYKGPAIERFLAKMTPEERAASERPLITPDMRTGPAMEPTEDEVVRGIDPNDHTTWPPDYKGPAIEDYLAEHPEEAAKLEAAAANPPVAPKLEGYEPTAEEAARGINPNEPSTWPSDYRGPAIEDAVKEMEAKQQVQPE
ncbi:MAG: hypothetical protein PHP44_00755 [Kiritimatiellae bacterium]|nr:hypothetical protein [Kiritimatiellia bacterium]MDD4734614.1 hypothetical protein [Kiritimatiellia bacterium]